jgi:hypothetical protein
MISMTILDMGTGMSSLGSMSNMGGGMTSQSQVQTRGSGGLGKIINSIGNMLGGGYGSYVPMAATLQVTLRATVYPVRQRWRVTPALVT